MGLRDQVQRLTPPLRYVATSAPGARFAVVLMMLSGCAGLGYQIVWTQQCALWLGHEAAAVLAVLAAFFGGLALGAWAFGDRIERSTRPWLWYAGCEAVICGWSLVLTVLMAPASAGLLALTGAQPGPAWQWAVAFGGTFVLLLPATAAMGATLPAIERATASLHREGTTSLAALYAANTLGAVAGVLASAFWLIPTFGLLRTTLFCVGCNAACAVGALAFRATDVPVRPRMPRTGIGNVLPMLAATGLLGIGYEVLVVRVLSQVAENTVYTYALLLAVYLVGSAIGAAAYQRWLVGRGDHGVLRDRLLTTLAAACLIGMAALWGAARIQAAAIDALGAGMPQALASEALLAIAAFGPATLVMGALFSHLAARACDADIGLGRCLAVNTLGAALAPLVFGVVLVPMLAPKLALLLVAAGYLALASPRRWRTPGGLSIAGIAFVAALWAPPLAFVDVPPSGHIVSYRDGAMASVSVVEDGAGVARLRIDNRQQEGSSATLYADARQALLPLLLHPGPKRALFLGLGTGVTAASAAEEAGLEVDAAELLPEVIDASRYFTRAFDDGRPNPRLHLITADARRYVRAATQRYDLIVADNFHPARSGSGALYTVEHFEAVRARLAPGGLFCQWLPLHQLDLATLRSIVGSFLAAYPQGAALLATNSLETPVLGLVGRADAGGYDVVQARRRLTDARLPEPASAYGIGDDLALFGSFVAGPAALARFASGAPLNTDDHPVVTYSAPRITYAPETRPAERLMAVLAEFRIRPDDVLADATADGPWRTRLASYWAARDRYLDAGRHVQPHDDAARMLADVRRPLLDVLRLSPDFRPAYDPLLAMAGALAERDPAAARRLLVDLATVQPARSEAREALERIAVPPR